MNSILHHHGEVSTPTTAFHLTTKTDVETENGVSNVCSSVVVSSGSSGRVGGTRNMKSMRPPLSAIFFMIYFYRAGGGGERHGPSARLPDPLLVVKVRISVLFSNLWQ